MKKAIPNSNKKNFYKDLSTTKSDDILLYELNNYIIENPCTSAYELALMFNINLSEIRRLISSKNLNVLFE